MYLEKDFEAHGARSTLLLHISGDHKVCAAGKESLYLFAHTPEHSSYRT